jgi:hypothetical protein
MRKGSKTSPRSLGARELLANPRRSHDRHRGLRARCNATPSADSSTYRHQDQHLVIASQSRKSVRRPRRLSNSHGRARPDIRPSSQIVGHRARCDQPLIVSRLTVEQLVASARCQISQLTRGAQFLTAPTAPLYLPQARFPSSEAFGRRPPSAPQHLSSGRHPKPLYGAYPCQVASGGAVESFYHVSRLHLRHGQLPCSAALSGQAQSRLRRAEGAGLDGECAVRAIIIVAATYKGH